MATIIDTLKIVLGLDIKDFEANNKKTQDGLERTGKRGKKTNDDLNEGAKEFAKSLEKVKNQVLSVTAVMLGASGLRNFVQGTVAANIQTGNLAKTLGTSIGELDKWQRAVKRVGGSPDGMAASLRAVSEAVSNSFNYGQSSSIVEALRKFFGHDLKIDKAGIIDLTDFMLKAADKMSKMSPNQALGFGRQMGLDDGTILLLMKGRKSVQDLLGEMEKIGPLTKRDYEESLKAAAAWDTMSESAQRLANTLTIKLAPAAGGALDAVSRLLQDPREFANRVTEFYGLRAKSYDKVTLTGQAQRRLRSVSGRVVEENSVVQTGNPFGSIERVMGLPTGLLDAVWSAESQRGRHMLSPKGAQGHFQFMPATAKAYGLNDPNNLGESAGAAARMFSDLLRQYGGNLQMALAAYNWGSGNLKKFGLARAPKETRDYIAKVMGSMQAGAGMGGGRNTTVNIGSVQVVTQATDARGIARSIGRDLNREIVAQANSGVN